MKKILLALTLSLLMVSCTNNPTKTDHPVAQELLVSNQIIVGISPDYPPFENLNIKGEIEGFDIDMLNSVIEILNKNEELNLTVTWKSMDFDTIVGALQASQIDIGVSGFTYDASRDVYFSLPYIISQQVVVAKDDAGINSSSDLKGKKVGVQSGTTGEEAAGEIEGVSLVSLADAQQLFAQLQTNAIDAVVIDKAVGDSYVKNNSGYFVLPEPLIDENMSIIVNKKAVNLQKALDKAIAEFLASDKYADLLNKWEISQ